MTSWARDWRKVWRTADPGTIIINRTGSYDNDRYGPVLFAIKDRLISAGTGAWYVLASSGKAGGGSLVADSNDNWISASDLVSATSDSGDRSWILLKSPTTKAGTFYLLIDWWGSNGLYCHFHFTRSQPDISTPQINARPAATGDEWSHNPYIVRSSDGSQYTTTMVAVLAHDGSFVIGVSAPVTTEFCFNALYVFNVLRNPKPWDPAKAVSYIGTNTNTKIKYNWEMGFQSLHSDGSQVTLEPVWLRGFGQNYLDRGTVNPWTDKWDSWPVPLVCTTTGKRTFRGELEDLYFSSAYAGDGVLLFANQVVKAICMGPFSVPFDQIGGAP